MWVVKTWRSTDLSHRVFPKHCYKTESDIMLWQCVPEGSAMNKITTVAAPKFRECAEWISFYRYDQCEDHILQDLTYQNHGGKHNLHTFHTGVLYFTGLHRYSLLDLHHVTLYTVFLVGCVLALLNTMTQHVWLTGLTDVQIVWTEIETWGFLIFNLCIN